jgi:ssDNA-binding Zn-finger/Zn-ribbon topoisomerase 1
MGQFESDSYKLVCPQCGLEGHASWSQNDGHAALRHGLQTEVYVSEGFTWGEKAKSGPESFFGRRLTCSKCNVLAQSTEIAR